MPLHALKNTLVAALLLAVPVGMAAAETTGLETLRAAAEKGQVDAQYELAILYEFGYNFPDHKTAAFVWYSRAADRGNARAAERRDLLQNELMPAELERAQALINKAAPTPAGASAR